MPDVTLSCRVVAALPRSEHKSPRTVRLSADRRLALGRRRRVGPQAARRLSQRRDAGPVRRVPRGRPHPGGAPPARPRGPAGRQQGSAMPPASAAAWRAEWRARLSLLPPPPRGRSTAGVRRVAPARRCPARRRRGVPVAGLTYPWIVMVPELTTDADWSACQKMPRSTSAGPLIGLTDTAAPSGAGGETSRTTINYAANRKVLEWMTIGYQVAVFIPGRRGDHPDARPQRTMTTMHEKPITPTRPPPEARRGRPVSRSRRRAPARRRG